MVTKTHLQALSFIPVDALQNFRLRSGGHLVSKVVLTNLNIAHLGHNWAVSGTVSLSGTVMSLSVHSAVSWHSVIQWPSAVSAQGHSVAQCRSGALCTHIIIM